ncbi:ABC transporter permease [Trichormus variabilis]|uniref:Iron export ABC transporter permease subunit FetB n=1 Tax=Trichormus variabilis SAG 1403-4b TaxID=447716 RepID=A0A433UYR7_ANAVA|nr:iron export ABC transporter permease subunit FetB [Trichormus variabilis]MBD2625739.1 iron export ABC transporter permease subunit FetB [Trichormus variabilis FACHB-164]RUS99024.1 iron export ABC transporter permease subunit FetB [Trichormus variabilis SAG 1403-4b]
MTKSYIAISDIQLGFSALFILINIALSWILNLGLGKNLLIASVRMVVQLLMVGYILQWVFTLRNPVLIICVAFAMTIMAVISSVNRTRRRFNSIYWNNFISLLCGSFLVTGFTVSGIIQVEPWYDPQYLIPLLGMILGNALTGTSLTLERFTEDLISRREQIEALLTLGATRWEAAHQTIREALRVGMIPTINSMMVMGLVSLPGMMTGQILAGASPSDAIRYQIVIIFAQASGTAISTMGVVLLAFLALFNQKHQMTDALFKQN